MKIHSPVESIRNLTIHPWRKNLYGVEVVSAVDYYDHILFRCESGKVYMQGAKRRKHPEYPLHDYFVKIVEALKGLDVVSDEDVDKHLKAVNEINERRKKGWEAKEFVGRASMLNIKLTKPQHKKLKALIDDGVLAENLAQPGSRYAPDGSLLVWEV